MAIERKVPAKPIRSKIPSGPSRIVVITESTLSSKGAEVDIATPDTR